MHWACRLTIKYGTLMALALLLAGFFFPFGSFYALSFCKTAVYSFAVSVIGGLMLDVIAARTGKRESK